MIIWCTKLFNKVNICLKKHHCQAKSNKVSSNMHFDYVQGRVHGEEQAPAGAAQWAEDGDWKSKDEGEGDSSRHHSQPKHWAGDQQAQQLQKGIYQLTCLHSGHIHCNTCHKILFMCSFNIHSQAFVVLLVPCTHNICLLVLCCQTEIWLHLLLEVIWEIQL